MMYDMNALLSYVGSYWSLGLLRDLKRSRQHFILMNVNLGISSRNYPDHVPINLIDGEYPEDDTKQL